MTWACGIFDFGNKNPSAHQRLMVRSNADDSFCSRMPDDFDGYPSIDGWRVNKSTAVALKLGLVEPHTDHWAGDFGSRNTRYRAMFWLIDEPKGTEFLLLVGKQTQRMRAGDFVMFNDKIIHAVFAKKIWSGVAYQVTRTKNNKPQKQAILIAGTAR